MAGGMSSGRSGLTLAERSARSGVPVDPAAGSAVRRTSGRGETEQRPTRTAVGCPRHCWVTNLPGAAGRCPGVALEWSREASGGWAARVAYAVRDGDQVVLVEAWVPAEHLAPANG